MVIPPSFYSNRFCQHFSYQPPHYLFDTYSAAFFHHLQYDLTTAMNLYKQCVELNPTDASIPIKMAGVHMDGGELELAKEMFSKALQIQKKMPGK